MAHGWTGILKSTVALAIYGLPDTGYAVDFNLGSGAEPRLVQDIEDIIWLDTSCLECGRETGFLPKDAWESVAIEVKAGGLYTLVISPVWGEVTVLGVGPDDAATCQGVHDGSRSLHCVLDVKTSGLAWFDLHAESSTVFEVQLEATL